MNRRVFKKQIPVFLLLVTAALHSGFSQEKRKITVEWIYGDDSQKAFALPGSFCPSAKA